MLRSGQGDKTHISFLGISKATANALVTTTAAVQQQYTSTSALAIVTSHGAFVFMCV